jgi:hypothetical protein
MWDMNEQVLREQHNELLRQLAQRQLAREALRARRLPAPQPGLIAVLMRRLNIAGAGRQDSVLRSRWRARKL